MAVKWGDSTSQTTGISSDSITSGANLLGSSIDNSANKDRWLDLELAFTCDVSPTAGKYIEGCVLYSFDGTNYEDGDDTTDPASGLVAVFPCRAATSAQRVNRVNIPIAPYAFKILLKSELDQDATSVTLTAYTHNENVV